MKYCIAWCKRIAINRRLEHFPLSRLWMFVLVILTGTIVLGPGLFAAKPATATSTQSGASPSEETVIAWVGGQNKTHSGLEVKFFISEPVMVKITDQTDSGISLLFSGVDEMDVSSMRFSDLSSSLSDKGLNVYINLDQAADFKVYQNYHADQFTILVSMHWQQPEKAS